METYRAVEIIADVHRSAGSSWLLGSGFLLRGAVVVSAAHVAGTAAEAQGASIWVRDLHAREWPAKLRAYDETLDLAVFEVPGLGESLDEFRIAAVDREQAGVVRDVLAVGFPGFKDAPEKPTAKRRQAAQADGWIPTAENYGGGELIFKLRVAPPEISPGSPWAGFSGAGVVVDERLVGIVIEHRSSEGPGSLTVRPVAALATASQETRGTFVAACGGIDFGALESISVAAGAGFPSRPQLRVRIDRVRRFARRSRSGATTFGTLAAPGGALAYGEGAFVQATLENGSSNSAIVSSLDVVVQAHDPSFVAQYPVIRIPRLHLEVPLTVIAEPFRLDALADLDGGIAVTSTQIALDPAGQATAHHTVDFGVVAAASGLWKLALRARHFSPQDPAQIYDVQSDSFYVAKQ